MKKIIAYVILAISMVSLAQCNSKNIKSETMKTTGASVKTDLKQIVVDVRTTEEWKNDGHATCSVNYPLDQFQSKIEELKKYDKVVIVCRSGNRAGIAKKQLIDAGYTKEVENLGPWQNLACTDK